MSLKITGSPPHKHLDNSSASDMNNLKRSVRFEGRVAAAEGGGRGDDGQDFSVGYFDLCLGEAGAPVWLPVRDEAVSFFCKTLWTFYHSALTHYKIKKSKRLSTTVLGWQRPGGADRPEQPGSISLRRSGAFLKLISILQLSKQLWVHVRDTTAWPPTWPRT